MISEEKSSKHQTIENFNTNFQNRKKIYIIYKINT